MKFFLLYLVEDSRDLWLVNVTLDKLYLSSDWFKPWPSSQDVCKVLYKPILSNSFSRVIVVMVGKICFLQTQVERKQMLAIINNYRPKGRWIVVDIYRDAKPRVIYLALSTDPLQYNVNLFSIFRTRASYHFDFRLKINSLGYRELRTPNRVRENGYRLL